MNTQRAPKGHPDHHGPFYAPHTPTPHTGTYQDLRHAEPRYSVSTPKWWKPYLDERDKQLLQLAGMFALGGVVALLGFALRWALSQL